MRNIKDPMKTSSATLTSWTDLELVEAFQRTKEEVYFNHLFERYYPLVYAKCLGLTTRREESKDLTLIVFTKVYGLLGREQLTHFANWLYTITQRECLNFLRLAKKSAETHRKWWVSTQSKADNFLENEAFRRVYYEEELRKDRLFRSGLEALAPEQRQCLKLFVHELKTYREIAELTGFKPEQVKSYLQNGRRKLKKWVTEQIEAQYGN